MGHPARRAPGPRLSGILAPDADGEAKPGDLRAGKGAGDGLEFGGESSQSSSCGAMPKRRVSKGLPRLSRGRFRAGGTRLSDVNKPTMSKRPTTTRTRAMRNQDFRRDRGLQDADDVEDADHRGARRVHRLGARGGTKPAAPGASPSPGKRGRGRASMRLFRLRRGDSGRTRGGGRGRGGGGGRRRGLIRRVIPTGHFSPNRYKAPIRITARRSAGIAHGDFPSSFHLSIVSTHDASGRRPSRRLLREACGLTPPDLLPLAARGDAPPAWTRSQAEPTRACSLTPPLPSTPSRSRSRWRRRKPGRRR